MFLVAVDETEILLFNFKSVHVSVDTFRLVVLQVTEEGSCD